MTSTTTGSSYSAPTAETVTTALRSAAGGSGMKPTKQLRVARALQIAVAALLVCGLPAHGQRLDPRMAPATARAAAVQGAQPATATPLPHAAGTLMTFDAPGPVEHLAHFRVAPTPSPSIPPGRSWDTASTRMGYRMASCGIPTARSRASMFRAPHFTPLFSSKGRPEAASAPRGRPPEDILTRTACSTASFGITAAPSQRSTPPEALVTQSPPLSIRQAKSRDIF